MVLANRKAASVAASPSCSLIVLRVERAGRGFGCRFAQLLLVEVHAGAQADTHGAGVAFQWTVPLLQDVVSIRKRGF